MLEDVLAVEVVHQANTAPHAVQAVDQAVDLLARGVHGERGAAARGDAEPAHQRLRAVVAGAHADALAAEDLGDVVRVHAVEGERAHGAAVREVARPVERQVGHLAQALDGVADDVARVLPHLVHPDRGQELDRGAEADRLGDRHRARLEARGRLGPLGLEVADAADHVPAGEERGHDLEQLAAAVQDADARRPVGLVAGPDVEVGAQRADVERHVGGGLRAVDDHDRAGRVGAGGDLGDRVDRARARWRRA